MSDALEAELDRLFKLPPAALVEARNALAGQLRKAGDKQAAARVKQLKRPTPAAWAINQLHFQQPALLDQARDLTTRVRALHARDGVDARELAPALNAQRAALNAAVEAALAQCADATQRSTLQRKIFATLQGWLAGTSDEVPGRMTHDVEAGGFDAVAAVGVPAARAPAAVPHEPVLSALAAQPALSTRAQRDRAEQRARAKAELARSERAVNEARELVQRRQAERAQLAQALDRERARVLEKERELNELRVNVSARAGELARAQAAFDEALAVQAANEKALAQLRAELDA